MRKMNKRYGIVTATCMVVGIVIGSGVFFKAQTVLQITDGDMPMGILAWIVGGLIIGDIAVTLNWATPEILFYGGITLLAGLTLSSPELADGLRIYRIFLVLATAFFGVWGFWIALSLVIISILLTPTFGGMSYFWPLAPFQGKALYRLLFRSPTYKAQPSTHYERGKVHNPK